MSDQPTRNVSETPPKWKIARVMIKDLTILILTLIGLLITVLILTHILDLYQHFAITLGQGYTSTEASREWAFIIGTSMIATGLFVLLFVVGLAIAWYHSARERAATTHGGESSV